MTQHFVHTLHENNAANGPASVEKHSSNFKASNTEKLIFILGAMCFETKGKSNLICRK